MIQRKLTALQYPLRDKFNIDDQKDVRLLIAWLFNKGLITCPKESETDLQQLSNVVAPNWDTTFQNVLAGIGGIPKQINAMERMEVISWLLSLALSQKYNDNRNKNPEVYNTANVNCEKHHRPTMKPANELDHFDFGSPEFISGIRDIANLVGIKNHPNHLVTLEAIATLVKSRMSKDVLKNLDDVKCKGKPWPYKEVEADMGFKSGDYVSNQASRILRLLYIHDLRYLQTKINECIVEIQRISANPKTDARLGKIGS